MRGTKILDLGSTTPTCVTELPAQRAMLVIQNNKMLGVLSITSAYGGSDMMGERTAMAEKDNGDESMSNSQENPGFGMGGCPDDKPDCQVPTGNNTAGGNPSGNNTAGGNSSGNNTAGGSSNMGGDHEQNSSFPGGAPAGNFTDEEVSFKFMKMFFI